MTSCHGYLDDGPCHSVTVKDSDSNKYCMTAVCNAIPLHANMGAVRHRMGERNVYNASPLHPANVVKKAWLLLLPAPMQWRYYPGASPSLCLHLCTAAVHCSQIHVHICKQWHEQTVLQT